MKQKVFLAMKRLTWVLCSFGSKLHPCVGQQQRVMAFQEPCSLKVALVLSFSVLSVVHFFFCLSSSAYSPRLVYGWLLNDLGGGFMSHVIRQQLMQRGPSLLFRAPFFFLGAKIAMMASSNTVFRPFWVKAEHST